MADVRPKSSASTGQACTQKGLWPTATRSGQPVHFVALPVTSFFEMTCHGQAWMQYSQPMQVSGSMTTGPSSYFVMASTGHTAAQTGYSQCWQLWRPQTEARPSSTGGSMTSQVEGFSV